jgi:hypothetical protein
MPNPYPQYYRTAQQAASNQLNQPPQGELKPIVSPLHTLGGYLEDRANMPSTGRVLQRLGTGSYGEIDPARVVRGGTELAMLVPQLKTAGTATQAAGAAVRPMLATMGQQGYKAALPELIKAAPKVGLAATEGMALTGTLTGNDRLIDLASMARLGTRGLSGLTRREIDIGEEGARNLAAASKNNAIINQLASAKRLYDRGLANESIHKQTGWRRLPGEADAEHWAYEISDDMARVKPNSQAPFLAGQFDHPQLIDAYPSIGFVERRANPNLPSNVAGKFKEQPGTFGRLEYNPNVLTTPDQQKTNLLHEIQHWIQHKEGWPVGGSPNAPGSVAAAHQQLLDTVGGPGGLSNMTPDMIEEMRKRIAIGNYFNQAGEVQARATAARATMNPAQRRARPPTLDYDRAPAEMTFTY